MDTNAVLAVGSVVAALGGGFLAWVVKTLFAVSSNNAAVARTLVDLDKRTTRIEDAVFRAAWSNGGNQSATYKRESNQ